MKRSADSRPQERDIDIFGLSHVGKVRRENQDQFFVASLHKNMRIWGTSVAEHRFEHVDEPVMAVLMVADGVGGAAGGRRASETAVEAVWGYIAGAVDVCWTSACAWRTWSSSAWSRRSSNVTWPSARRRSATGASAGWPRP